MNQVASHSVTVHIVTQALLPWNFQSLRIENVHFVPVKLRRKNLFVMVLTKVSAKNKQKKSKKKQHLSKGAVNDNSVSNFTLHHYFAKAYPSFDNVKLYSFPSGTFLKI